MNDRASDGEPSERGSTILVGDVGGTKTALALDSKFASSESPIVEKVYRNSEFADFEAIVEAFLTETGADATVACFAVAGPVFGSVVRMTNRPWAVDSPRIAKRFGFGRVDLLNDTAAIALSIPRLPPLDLLTLHPGSPDPDGAIVVIAPGTGLGEAYLTPQDGVYAVHASEGGHAGFAPSDDLQSELMAFLRAGHEHVSIERIASGQGIPLLYRFLRDVRGLEEPAELRSVLASSDDPTPIIVATAIESRTLLCTETLRLYASILGSEAGDAALRLLATGGIYLGGGLPPRILPFLQDERFLAAIHAKGRFEPALKRIPVHVILDSRAALRGAAEWSRRSSNDPAAA